jgi:alpha-L-fucosidase
MRLQPRRLIQVLTLPVVGLLILAGCGVEGSGARLHSPNVFAARDEPGGTLEFRILATRTHDEAAAEAALTPNGLAHPPEGYRWARLGEMLDGLDPSFTEDTVSDIPMGWVRDRYAKASVELFGEDREGQPSSVTAFLTGNTGDTLHLDRPHGLERISSYRLHYRPCDDDLGRGAVVRQETSANGIVEEFVLVKLDTENLSERELERAYPTEPGVKARAIALKFSPQGAAKLGRLTRANLPEGRMKERLAILLDNVVIAAPAIDTEIRDGALIEGGGRNGFSAAEAERIVRLLTHLIVLDPDPPAAKDDATLQAPESARTAFQNARFGLFIHWGIYSMLGKGEWVMERDKLPISEYEKLAPRFNPTEFDPEAWVKLAKSAGIKYITVTAKHHDGFCMFDSKLTRYDIAESSPYARDPLKTLADACRKQGISLFFYYSLLDWHHPDYFPVARTGKTAGRESKGEWSRYVAYYQGQVRELCTNYGPIGGIWFDGWWDKPGVDWDLAGTYRLIHQLQPNALVGNNHHVVPKPGEDFQIFERDLPGENSAGFNKAAPDPKVPWECCQTLNRSWGYNAKDHAYKGTDEVIRLLVGAAGRNANLLLNVAPKPDGTMPAEAIERLTEVGRWLETHGDSIYGTREGPIPPQPWGYSTIKAEAGSPIAAYLHVLKSDGEIRLPEIALSFDARLLRGTKLLKLAQDGKQAVLVVPEADRSPLDTVIVLTPKVLDPAIPARRLKRP